MSDAAVPTAPTAATAQRQRTPPRPGGPAAPAPPPAATPPKAAKPAPADRPAPTRAAVEPVTRSGRRPQVGSFVHFWMARGAVLECSGGWLVSYSDPKAGGTGRWSVNIQYPGGIRHQREVPYAEVASNCCWSWPANDELTALELRCAALEAALAALQAAAAKAAAAGPPSA